MAGAPVCPAGAALLQPRELSGDVGVCLLREVPAWGSPAARGGPAAVIRARMSLGGNSLQLGVGAGCGPRPRNLVLGLSSLWGWG